MNDPCQRGASTARLLAVFGSIGLLAVGGCLVAFLLLGERDPGIASTPERHGGAPVLVGLDRVAAGDPEALAPLRGKLGLVAHAASLTLQGRHAIDVFGDRGLELVRLFGPEHGLRGEAAAGESVTNGLDAETSLPIVSLYGAKVAPGPEDLGDLDGLVVDLQDAGVRFYTYSSTLILCLEAAAEAGIRLVVLDRPNPLGGEHLAGPLSAPRGEVPRSLVNTAPGPLVHGLTMGEIARYWNRRLEKPADLVVVAMGGWERSMTWRDTGRPWTNPSPNLRSPEAALAYPGVALLEATNLSEGRGTPTPFLLFGAPWLDHEVQDDDLLNSLPGFRLHSTRFVPRASAAAPTPKYLDIECFGWRIELVDPAQANAYRLGVLLLSRLATAPEFEWRRNGDSLTSLIGNRRLLAQLQAGTSVERILAEDEEEHRLWREDRQAALLY